MVCVSVFDMVFVNKHERNGVKDLYVAADPAGLAGKCTGALVDGCLGGFVQLPFLYRLFARLVGLAQSSILFHRVLFTLLDRGWVTLAIQQRKQVPFQMPGRMCIMHMSMSHVRSNMGSSASGDSSLMPVVL